MADNDIGVKDVVGGSSVATDDVAGVHYQRVKLVDGTLDSDAGIPGGVSGLLVNLTGMKAEDVAAAGGDLGLPILAVRTDTLASLVGTDGDYTLLQVDSSGRLRVVTEATASYLEDAAAASGDRGLFVLAQRHDANDSTVSADGDYSALHVDSSGRLKVVTAASYLEDDAAVSGDRGLFVLAVRRDGVDASTAGTDGDYSAMHLDNLGRMKVVNRANVVRLSQTPTVSSGSVYAAKDVIGTLLTFANAARVSGGSALLQSVQIEDKGQQMSAMDLVLFDRTLTPAADNAIFAPSDAELATCIGVIPLYTGDYYDFSTNSVASKTGVGLEFVLNGTDLFGVLVARGTPTYTSTSDITVTLTIIQDN